MSRSERKTTTQPDDWWRAFEAAAQKEGKTLAAWMGDVCVASLPKRVQAKLSERPRAHRPKRTKEANNE